MSHKNTLLTLKGLSLLELLLALTLSCFVLGSIASIYSLTKHNCNTIFAISEIQNNAMIAFHFLGEELHRTGSLGCRNARLTAFPNEYIEIIKNDKDDELILHQMNPRDKSLSEDMLHNTEMQLEGDLRASVGDLAIISDCESYELFRIEKISTEHHTQKLQTHIPLKHLYHRFAQVGLWQEKKIYIQKTNRQTNAGKPVFALFEKIDQHPSREWVEGVSHFILSPVFENSHLMGLTVQIDFIAVTSGSFEKTISTWIGLPNAS